MLYDVIGGGVATLGLLLSLQRLNKPIYRFRLRCLGIRLLHLVAAGMIGFLVAVFTAVLPNLFVDSDQISTYSIVWGIYVGLLIVGTYILVSLCLFIPARLMNINYRVFVYAAANLLSEAKDEDLAAFAQDIAANISKIFQFARAREEADRHASRLVFARLEEEGKPLSYAGAPPISAFYRFTKRKELARGYAARDLLILLADKKLCHVLVRDCPWVTARLLDEISRKRLLSEGTQNFVQEIARQAMTKPDSVLTHEIEYDGLGIAPFLSNALFNNRFILREYKPFRRLSYPLSISKDFIRKINYASMMALKLSLNRKDFWDSSDFRDIQSIYKGISRELGWHHRENDDRTYPEFEWSRGIKDIYNETNQTLSRLEPDYRKNLFRKKDEGRSTSDLISIITEIVFNSLEGISNDFRGHEDKYWGHAFDTYMALFDKIYNERDGLNPLQQRILWLIVDKVRHNMEGFYPSISRVILAVIGPFGQKISGNEKSPENIIQNLVYAELRNLSKLHENSPEKVSKFLPENVTYDGENNSLAHKYSNGEVKITYLDEIEIVEFDLFDESIWDLSPAEQPNRF